MTRSTRPRTLPVIRLAVGFALGLSACSSPDPSNADTSGDATETDPTSGPSTETETDTTPMGDCGNDILEDGEECDGAELGGMTCSDVDPAFASGTLACGATCTFDASGCMLAPGSALVALNELTSEAVLAGEFAGPNDAIELHNAGDAAADLSGWQLSDDPTLIPDKTYVFPAGTTIEPGAFMVLLSEDLLASTGDFPFGISDTDMETIVLADADGAIVDEILVDGYKARVSYCRVPDASGAWFQCEQTFGAANQTATVACGNGMIEDPEECDGEDVGGATCESLGVGYTGGTVSCTGTCKLDGGTCTTTSDVVINELEATDDNIEIFNASAAPFDLSGLVLTDDKVELDYDPMVDTGELVFAPGTTIEPGAYLVVPVGLGPGQHPFGLGLSGDTVTLVDPVGPEGLTVIDQVRYGDGEATTSYCRLPNGPGGTWTADCSPTLGGANQ